MTVLINGVTVSPSHDESMEFAAVRELLRQRAIAAGVIGTAAQDEGEVGTAIETLLQREVATPEPTKAECRRYYEHHRHEFESGDLIHARHILFQVAPGVNVVALRARAEQTLNELLRQPERFAAMAAELSNCPLGKDGGNLGQIGRGDTVPEFERALFRLGPTGILPEVVKTRYGFHLVAVDRRIPGNILPVDVVKERMSCALPGGHLSRAQLSIPGELTKRNRARKGANHLQMVIRHLLGLFSKLMQNRILEPAALPQTGVGSAAPDFSFRAILRNKDWGRKICPLQRHALVSYA